MAEKDELLSHNYDGIQEYDNDLPKWWVWLFVLTTVWGVWRVVYYHFGPGLLQEEQLAVAMKDLDQKRAQHAPKSDAGESDETLLALTVDSSHVSAGKSIYEANCVACHLPQGQGLVGPNLTDDFWIHGGRISEIRKVISEGVEAKGMIAWKKQLNAQQLNDVAAYVWTLNGTNPPNPKKEEGTLVPRK